NKWEMNSILNGYQVAEKWGNLRRLHLVLIVFLLNSVDALMSLRIYELSQILVMFNSYTLLVIGGISRIPM
ncbi:MAG: hypothetical protein ACKO96_32975, partial [Flammeovirgaceae bacterium]